MKSKIKKEPIRIYLEYKTSVSGGEPEDPSDRWTCHSDTVKEVSFIKLYRSQPKDVFFYNSIEIEDESFLKENHLYLAVVRYSTGNTFGRSTGEHEVVGLFKTEKDAEEFLKEETKPSKKGDYSRYRAWEGYFERLEGTEVHKLELIDE